MYCAVMAGGSVVSASQLDGPLIAQSLLVVDLRQERSDSSAMTTPTWRAGWAWVSGRRKRAEITASTAARNLSIITSFADSYGHRPVDRLSRTDIERWQGQRGHLAPGTRRHEFSVMRSFCRHLAESGKIRRDPTVGMKAPRVPRPADRALTADQVETLETSLPDTRAKAVFALMRWCGLRRAEVLALQVGDWDRRAETIRVIGKGGHHRVEPVPAWVARPLADYLAEHGATSGPMIRTLDGARGISNSYLGRLMSGWMTDCGVKRAPGDGMACHSLRHTIASELVESGADLPTVQEFLGHVSITSTQVYLRRAAVGRVRDALYSARGEGDAA